MYSSFLIGHLFMSSMCLYPGFNLRTNSSNTCVTKKLDHMLQICQPLFGSITNTIGRTYVTNEQEKDNLQFDGLKISPSLFPF